MIAVRAECDTWWSATLGHLDINVGFARAVLENLVDGRLWADRAPASRAMHALHPYGMSLVWGDALDEAIGSLVSHLRAGEYRATDEWLQIDPRWHSLDWDSMLDAVTPGNGPSAHRPVRFSRVNFAFDRARFAVMRGSDPIPAGWSVRRATASDFGMAGSVVPRYFWRSAEQFLAHGGGWCIERDGVVGAVAFASFRFGDEVELGIETLPALRGQGLALAIATAMIRDLVAEGLTPVWSCRRENHASYELALKLGFYVTKVMPYYKLPSCRDLTPLGWP